jgi:YVTN family beta-propeller protein
MTFWRGLAAAFALLFMRCEAAPGQDYLSPLALAADLKGEKIFVAEDTARQVVEFDAASEKATRTISLPDAPSGLALSPDSRTLYVTGASPAGKLYVIDVETGKATSCLPVGHTPTTPVLSPDGKTLYVLNRFDNNISIIDLASKKETARVPALREPFAAAITPDGRVLCVANLLPEGPADADVVAAAVTLIDTANRSVAATIRLPNGSTGLQGICLSPDGRYAYVTHTLGRYRLPTTQIERGWINTNALSVIDVDEKSLVNTVLLDNIDLGAATPWGVVCTADGRSLCVACAGVDEVSVIDRIKLHEKLAKVAAGEQVSEAPLSAADVPNDLSFLVGLRRRASLAGKGPRGVAAVDGKIYAAEYFSDSLGMIDLASETPASARSLPLGPQVPLTTVRKGEMLFNDATICFQHWLSCASCHPGEARVDGLNWDLLNDGIGTPKSTKSMLLAHKTPPTTVTGIRPDAQFSVRAGITHILFAVRPEEEAAAMDEYLSSLKPVPSPHLVNGSLSPAAVRGKRIFDKAGCAACHPAPMYTDLKKYDVGTGKGKEEGRAFDTPALVECWRTAPYLYDGRAADMKELLTIFNGGDRHGVTSGLSQDEIDDLIEFILSL